MTIFEKLIEKNADDRLEEEMLYAEAVREMENGIRRDGLWGKAIACSAGDEKKIKAQYLKFRVKALKDELEKQREIMNNLSSEEEKINSGMNTENNISSDFSAIHKRTSFYYLGKFIGSLFK